MWPDLIRRHSKVQFDPVWRLLVADAREPGSFLPQATNRKAIRHRFGRDAVVSRVKALANLRSPRPSAQD